MTGPDGSPIEDYLDELLRRVRADPRTTRRLLEEATDHLSAAAAELQAAGTARVEAEREAVRRFGPPADLASHSRRRSFAALVGETTGAAVLLGACGLVAVGVSGVVVAVMNQLLGRSFVGGTTVWGTGGAGIAETARDAVVLRALAGVVGLVVLAGYAALRRYAPPAVVLPPGLVDALGAAAFAAATVALASASFDQAFTAHGSHGMGFFLSGALVSLTATIVFSTRASQALLQRAVPTKSSKGQAELAQ